MHFPLFRISPYISEKNSDSVENFSIYLYSEKIIIPPNFPNFPPDFVKFTCFLHTFCFSFPLRCCPKHIYASHNARAYWTPLVLIDISQRMSMLECYQKAEDEVPCVKISYPCNIRHCRVC